MKRIDYDSIIFDMDGTMVDNLPYHWKAWKQLASKFGVKITREFFFYKMNGRTNKDLLPMLLGIEKSALIKKYAEKKENHYRRIYWPHVKEIKGLTLLVKELKSRGVKVGMATSAPKKNVDFILKKLKVGNLFNATVTGDRVKRSKPNPEIYLTTANKLKVEPKNCLVFEDAENGVEAAKGAGMKVIAVLRGQTKKYSRYRGTAVSDFTKVKVM